MDEDFTPSERSRTSTSSFHNFQKHLSQSLKNSIEIPQNIHEASKIEELASKMWKAFRKSKNTTKKVLHYLLGEENEHKINVQGLKEFGLYKLY